MRWPLISESPVDIGGITVSCEEALRACDLLNASGASAIRAILRAAGNRLADCDYHAVYRPGLAAARGVIAKTGRIGPRGRHLAKHAFAAAVRQKVIEAACRALEDTFGAFGRDERYATAIASDAVTILSRSGHRRGSIVITDSDSCHGYDAVAA